ncbi:MFS transporter [Sphingosinicella xenopeptidilytica]|uniref:MFS transporter n=1 Tax=Sphingosinicella xenopeptidilytica TaxID=364098 RepID=A0ABW3C647_SPHXN
MMVQDNVLNNAKPWAPYFQLALLALAVTIMTYFRQSLGPLQEDLRLSLLLSDNQIALIQGLMVSIPVALVSIPLGFITDRVSRSRLIVMLMALGLLAIVISAFAQSFLGLGAARIPLGIASSGVLIAAYSLVGDLVPLHQRGRAATFVAIGEKCGGPLAFALGGAVLVTYDPATAPQIGAAQLQGWSWALLWMAGLALPFLLPLLLLREQPRHHQTSSGGNLSIHVAMRMLWNYRRVVVPIQLGRATLSIADGAVIVWGAPFFARKFHLPPDQIGAIMGSILLISGILGLLFGGPLVDFYMRRGGPRLVLTCMAAIALFSIPCAFFALLPSVTIVAFVMCLFLVAGFTIATCALGLNLIVIPSELRGLNLGITIVIGAVFFTGLAPLTISLMSGALGGEHMIGTALALVCGTASVLNAAIFLFGIPKFPRANETLGEAYA